MVGRLMPESLGFSVYACPHCRASLEVRSDDLWTGWRRCPACDRPLLPPELGEKFRTPWQSFGPTREELLLAGEVESADRRSPRPFEPFDPSRGSRQVGWCWYRRSLTIGLALSLFALLVAFLEQSQLAQGVLSLISLILFLLLMRPIRKR